MKPSLRRHPGERARIAYALGDASAPERARLAAHLIACDACRAHVHAVIRLRDESHQVTSEPALASVLERVLATRAAGVRGISPAIAPTPGRRPVPSVRRAIDVALAAATVAFAAWGIRTLAGARESSPRTFDAFAASELFAQGIPGVKDPSPVDTARVARLRPGSWRYEARIRSAITGEWARQFEERYELRRPAAGELLWVRVIPRGAVTAAVDSARFRSPSLRYERSSSSHFGRPGCEQRLADGVLSRRCVRLTGPGGVRSDSAEVPLPFLLLHRTFLPTAMALPLVLRGVPIDRGRAIRLPLFAEYVGSDGRLVTEARTLVLGVTGTAGVRVPAGTFDCWVLEIRAGDGSSLERLWVDRTTQVLVRRETSVRGKVFRVVELQSSGQ